MTNYDYEEGDILGWHEVYGTRKLFWDDEAGGFFDDASDYVPLSWVSLWMRVPMPPAPKTETAKED